MMTPGFSAETSLHRSSLAYYQLALLQAPGPNPCDWPRIVAPARRRIVPGGVLPRILALALGAVH
jgi:hypothetical protein